MKASDRQVGGDHYKGGVNHWDYCVRSETPYLEAAASKYVTRWRKKNGVQDLEKAIHYLEKRVECVEHHIGTMKGGLYLPLMFGEFTSDNDCTVEEAGILYLIMHWTSVSQLQTAIARIRILILNFEESKCQDCENCTCGAAPTSAYVDQDR